MKNAPLYAVLAYIGFTFALIVLGPISYIGFNPIITSIFIGCTMFAILFGYNFGSRTFDRHMVTEHGNAGLPFAIDPILRVCVALAIGGLLVSIASSLAAGTLNLSPGEIGQTYVDGYADYERNTGSYSLNFIIYSITLAPTFIASIWGLYYFGRLSPAMKVAVLVLILGNLLFYTIGSGKQKQLGDTIIYLIAIGAIAFARSGRQINLRMVMTGLVGAFTAIAGFVFILSQRYSALSVDALNIVHKSHPLQQFNIEHPVFALFGYDVGFALAVLWAYLSQGYFGLSLALESDMTWSYMIGFSYSLTVIVNRLTGLPWVIDQTYPYVVGVETGWAQTKWHSIFPHWASDFTFPGTVVLFGFFAFVFARAWREAVAYENPFAILLFSMMVLGAFFIPANNQLFLSPGSLVNVTLIVGMYVIFHKRFNHPALRGAE